MAQLDMFAAETVPQTYISVDPDRVRRKLDALLAEARDTATLGLPQSRRRLIETVVPQMTRWLPEDEAEVVRQMLADALKN
ncbi:hypothetical protein [Xanthobacter oligotrophicus]|uniref:hypothetical protein n=1 Tax=Xanthobacter oligotrophicus TaxID=2607286 RepID=UPI0011F09E7A|nr:hypothetical protein [Xanthobacter oligotrophicus]MCG5234210.1 hypothetical protein [Xanthobacter oligotrophicus]